MTILPIIERELRVASRKRLTYNLRLIAAATAALLCGWMAMMQGRVTVGSQVGIELFRGMTFAVLSLCMLPGLFLTSACLSEEKREGTLGLLFLTDLSGWEVMTGKLMANGWNALYGLLSLVPVFAIPFLIGGIGWQPMVALSGAALSTLLLSLSLGILASTLARNERESMVFTLFLLLLVIGGLPIAGEWLQRFGPWLGLLEMGSPWQLARWIRGGDWWELSLNLAGIVGISILAVGFAGFLLARLWRWEARLSASGGLVWRWDGFRIQRNENHSGNSNRRCFRENPIDWLGSRDTAQRVYVWIVLGTLGIVWVWGYTLMGSFWLHPEMLMYYALLTFLTLKLWVAIESCRRWQEERRMGSLELLLTTPLTAQQVFRGHLISLSRQFGFPVLAALGVLLIFCELGRNHPSVDHHRGAWTGSLGAMGIALVCDMVALAVLGLWNGLVWRRLWTGVTLTVAGILVLPWLLTWFGLFLAPTPTPESRVVLWISISILVDVLFVARIVHAMKTRFRSKAAELA